MEFQEDAMVIERFPPPSFIATNTYSNAAVPDYSPPPLFERVEYVGHLDQEILPPVKRTPPSPLFVDDDFVGDVDSRYLFHRSKGLPDSGQSLADICDLLISPSSLPSSKSPSSSTDKELDSNTSTQQDDDQDDTASDVVRELGTPESQIESDEDLGGFIAPDDAGFEFESKAALDGSCSRRGKLVSKKNGGKAVKQSHKRKIFSIQKTTPTKKRASPDKKKSPRNMLKELDPHLEDVAKKTREDPSATLFDTSTVKLTRSQARALNLAAQNKPQDSRKMLDLKVLMEEQLRPVRYQKTYYQANEKTPQKIHKRSEGLAGGVKNSPLVEVNMTDRQRREAQGLYISNKMIDWQNAMASEDWDKWDSRKTQTTTLLSMPRYSAPPTTQDMGTSSPGKTAAYLYGCKVPDDYNLSMDQGLHIFSPTKSVFEDFPSFLEVVEEVAGREHGVVKVVVPKECLQPRNKPSYGSSNQADLKALKTCLTNLKSQKSRVPSTTIYDVLMPSTEGLAAAAWRKSIQDDRRELQKHLGPSGDNLKDIWQEVHVGEKYNEDTMIKYNEKWADCVFYAADIDATDDLRDTLRCGNPNFATYQGNSLSKSRSIRAGVNTSVFHVSSTDATLFGMRIAELGAYSLNYLHDGAPQIWTVVKPTAHEKLERTLHSFLQVSKSGGKVPSLAIPRPYRPPECDNFLRHQPMYIPEGTLKMYDIEYTKVVQYLGEMVITFPFAYHQAYNAGANITESMAYASNRWEVFPMNKLLKDCHRGCSSKKNPSEFHFEFIGTPASEQSTSIADIIGPATPSPPSSSASSPPRKKHSTKRRRLRTRVTNWEGDDGAYDESSSDHASNASDHSGPPETPSKARRFKRAQPAAIHINSDDPEEVKLIKQKILQVRKEIPSFGLSISQCCSKK